MGMFDWVNVEMDCPACGKKIGKFQSKSGYCCLIKIDPTEVSDFYGYCSCGEIVRYSRPVDDDIVFREKPFTKEEVEELGFYRCG